MSSDDSSLMVRERWAACAPGYFCSQDSSALGYLSALWPFLLWGYPSAFFGNLPLGHLCTLPTLLPAFGPSLLLGHFHPQPPLPLCPLLWQFPEVLPPSPTP